MENLKELVAFLLEMVKTSYAASDLKEVEGGLENIPHTLILGNYGFSLLFVNGWEISLNERWGSLFLDVRVPRTATTVSSHGGGQVPFFYEIKARQWYDQTIDYLLSLPAE